MSKSINSNTKNTKSKKNKLNKPIKLESINIKSADIKKDTNLEVYGLWGNYTTYDVQNISIIGGKLSDIEMKKRGGDNYFIMNDKFSKHSGIINPSLTPGINKGFKNKSSLMSWYNSMRREKKNKVIYSYHPNEYSEREAIKNILIPNYYSILSADKELEDLRDSICDDNIIIFDEKINIDGKIKITKNVIRRSIRDNKNPFPYILAAYFMYMDLDDILDEEEDDDDKEICIECDYDNLGLVNILYKNKYIYFNDGVSLDNDKKRIYLRMVWDYDDELYTSTNESDDSDTIWLKIFKIISSSARSSVV